MTEDILYLTKEEESMTPEELSLQQTPVKEPSNWDFYKEIDPVLSLVECPKCHNKGVEWLCSGYKGNPVIGIQCTKCLSLLTKPFGIVLKTHGLQDTVEAARRGWC